MDEMTRSHFPAFRSLRSASQYVVRTSLVTPQRRAISAAMSISSPSGVVPSAATDSNGG